MITDSLKIRFGAVTLVLVTLTAVVFSLINFQQREEFQLPDDGVSWLDTPSGVVAWNVSPDSPAARAGIRKDDRILAIERRQNLPRRASNRALGARGLVV